MSKTFGTPAAPPRFRWADQHWQALVKLAVGASCVADVTEELNKLFPGAALSTTATKRQLDRLRDQGLADVLPDLPLNRRGPDIAALRALIAQSEPAVDPESLPGGADLDDYPEAP